MPKAVSQAEREGSPESSWGGAPSDDEGRSLETGGFGALLRLLTDQAPTPTGEAREELLTTLEEQIIPQLVLAHFADPAAPADCPDERLPPAEAEIRELATIAVAEDLSHALAFIETIVSQGVSVETVLLQLVASAARLLGDQWLEDERSFAEVTLGLGTLQRLVHVLGPGFALEVPHRGWIVLVAAPAEQHTLGIHLLGELFRRAGWGVQVEPNMPAEELLQRVRRERVAMVGISVSNRDLLEPVARLVGEIRKASLNRDLAVMLGGSLQISEDALPGGATFCGDPRAAVRWLDQHVRNGDRARPGGTLNHQRNS